MVTLVSHRFFLWLSVSKRRYCSVCELPEPVCVCAAIRPVTSGIRPIILQHPDESGHPKNTARLVQLALNNCEVHCGETAADFVHLQQSLPAPESWLMFPDEQAILLDVATKRCHLPASTTAVRHDCPLPEAPHNLIVIDATWRKAQKMMALNPWLEQFPRFQVQLAGGSQYWIRKHKAKHSLSTLEAVAATLGLYDAQSAQALTELFEHFKQQKLKAMPRSIQQRILQQVKNMHGSND